MLASKHGTGVPVQNERMQNTLSADGLYKASKVKDAVIDHIDAVCYLVQGHELEDGLAEDEWPQLCWHASHQQWCTISIYGDTVIHCDSAPFVHHKALDVILAASCLCGLAAGILRKDELPQQPLGRQFVLQGQLVVCDNQAITSMAVVYRTKLGFVCLP